MSRGRRTPAVAAVVVAVGATALVATLPEPRRADVPTATATAEPVSRTVLACPPGRADASVRVVAAAELPTTGRGPAEVDLLQPGEPARQLTVARGELEAVGVSRTRVLVRGDGGAARGLLAARAERSGGTLVAAGCVAPEPTWWFAGAGGDVDHSSVLFLTNSDEGPAVVDVRVHGASGSVDEAGLRGITLAPGETRRLPLAEVAPGSPELTVEVSSTRGRVAAHLLDSLRTDRGPGQGWGREWLPPAAPPGEDVVLAGVPTGAEQVRLLVTNPGEQQALVDLEVLTDDGAFVPLGTEQLSVDPGTVERVDLTEELEGRAAAVRLRSEVPVTGAVRATLAGDVGYAGPVAPLSGPAGVVLAGSRSEIQVAAGDEAVSVQLLLHDQQGRELLRRAVNVPPSGLVRVPAPAGAAYAVLIPRSGGGYAAALHTRPGLAGQPVLTLPSTVLRAAVLPWAGEDDR